MANKNVVHPGPPSHDGPTPQYTGGNHPRGKLFGPDKTGIKSEDPGADKTDGLGAAVQVHGPGDARGVNATQGYTVIGESPVSDAKPYDSLCREREYVGIPIDEDLDGDYTGGTGNRSAS